MPTRWIPYVKVLVHLFCLAPAAGIYAQYRSGALALQSDPVNLITHWTGDWALWLLLVSLAVTPLRRLHPKLSNLIRFRRLLGLYAFFYASLHLATYVLLYSGYDIQTALAGLKQGHSAVLVEQWKVVWPDILIDLQKRRFIQVGLFAFVLLFALALTSPGWVLRKMGGRNWQRLHRLVYVAAGAACIHYWWLVKAGVRKPLPDTVILGVLLLARVIWVMRKQQKAKPPSVKRTLNPV